jgi:hypothetical protein
VQIQLWRFADGGQGSLDDVPHKTHTGKVKALAAAGFACFVLLGSGCGGGVSAQDETTTSTVAPTGEFGSYPADASLDEQDVVEAYVRALDARDGEAFCRIVATWISGRFDIAGRDPDGSSSRPFRCPQIVPGVTDFPWENQERDFKGASVADVGDFDERGDDLVGVPVSITLRIEEDGRGVYDKRLEDVVWLTKDAGAWRVAKLSMLARWAALTEDSEAELTSPPDVRAERRAFAVEVAKAQELRSAREASYRVVHTSATCPEGKTYPDGSDDVVDYRHPAPPTPTPQLPAADIRAVHVHASGRRICVLLELAGPVQTGTVFVFAIESPDFEWGRSGFSQGFEVELRADGHARVTSGRDDQRRPVSVPAEIGRAGNRLMLAVGAESFSTGRPFPGSTASSGPLSRFTLRASVTVEVSEERLLHDDLGPGPPEGVLRYPYP